MDNSNATISQEENSVQQEVNEETQTSASTPKGNVFLIYIAVGIAVTILVVIGITLFRGSSTTDPVDVVSKDEKSQILTEIALNNPKGIINLGVNEGTANPAPGQFGAPNYNSAGPNQNSLVPVPIFENGRVIMPGKLEVSAPDLATYNYEYTKSAREIGPKIDSCTSEYGYGYGYILNVDSVTEFYSYFDEGRSYYKSVVSNSSGGVEMLSISKYGKDISEYYNYRGGTLAVKEKYEPYADFSNSYRMTPISYPNSYPQSYPVSYNNEVSRTFGPNARITKEYEKNGVTYYEISTKFEYGCRFYESDEAKFKPTLYVYQVNGDTFEIEETAYYVDNANSNNLIWKTNVTSTKSKADFNSVSNKFESNTCNFVQPTSESVLCSQEVKTCWDGSSVGRNSSHSCEFDFCAPQAQSISSNICGNNQEVRLLTIDYSNYSYDSAAERNRKINYLSGQDIVMPLADTFGITSIYGISFPKTIYDYDYIYRKDYYSQSESGQQAYNNQVDSLYYNSLGQYSASKGNDYFTMYIFDKSTFGQDKIEDIILGDENSRVRTATSTVEVDNQTIDSKIFFVKTKYGGGYPISYPASYPSSYPSSYPIDNVDINSSYHFQEVFEYDNFVYVVEQWKYNLGGYVNNFKTYRTSNPSQMNTISNFIQTYRY